MLYRVFLILAFLSLSACGVRTPTTTPPAPEIWKVQVSSSLDWLRPSLNTCTLAQEGKGILVVDGSSDLVPEISFEWAAIPSRKGSAAEIGRDDLAIIVYPENPLQSLTLQELQAIYGGKLRSWQELSQTGLPSGRIETLILPEEDDTSRMVRDLLSPYPVGIPGSVIAPDADAMRQVISSNSLAIGYLPGRWVDNTIRRVEIRDIPAGSLSYPILAVTAAEPEGQKLAWILCLQEAIYSTSQP